MPERVRCLVEIPKASRNKYECNEELQAPREQAIEQIDAARTRWADQRADR